MKHKNHSTKEGLDKVQQEIPTLKSFLAKEGSDIPVELIDCKWMSERFSDTFKRPPMERIEEAFTYLPEGLLVKIMCEWPTEYFLERFWIEITEVVPMKKGGFAYYGELRDNTLVGEVGDRIGPISTSCICDLDLVDFRERFITN